MKIEVYNCTLKDVIDEILHKIDEHKKLEDFKLELIHKYKYGTKIKDYIRSYVFTKEISQDGYHVKRKYGFC